MSRPIKQYEVCAWDYFRFDGFPSRVIQIRPDNINFFWENYKDLRAIEINQSTIDQLDHVSNENGVSYSFGDVSIMPMNDGEYKVGFKDLLGINQWTGKTIKDIHQLQHLCLDINQEPLQFVK